MTDVKLRAHTLTHILTHTHGTGCELYCPHFFRELVQLVRVVPLWLQRGPDTCASLRCPVSNWKPVLRKQQRDKAMLSWLQFYTRWSSAHILVFLSVRGQSMTGINLNSTLKQFYPLKEVLPKCPNFPKKKVCPVCLKPVLVLSCQNTHITSEASRYLCVGQHTHSAPSTTVYPERNLTFKNPVIMKYVNVPSKGHFSGQRSGSLSGQHFWEWMKLVCCTRTPEHSRWMHVGVMLVLHLRAVSLLISTTPLLY